MSDKLTTKAAAVMLGKSDARVRQLAIAGKLKGKKHGPDWIFDIADVVAYRDRRKEARR